MTTILITGANRGIGLEFVKQYAAEGAEVIACCRDPARADALKTIAGSVRVLALDVADPKSLTTLLSELNGMALDIVINNAGVGGPRGRPQGIVDFDLWLNIFAVNSVAPTMIAVALHPNLMAGRDRKLVTITSQLGSIANHGGGAYPYHASKAAVNSFMHGLAKAWTKDGISVGLFHPGWVQTDMGGPSAPVTPAESVTGLRARIAELGVRNSGSYRDYTGKEIAW
ncbi:MAG TPA: SDR family oxidoreductase [Rhizomicrobium sp.]|jgi:NAD(P)-dependent dehydrogenase (short-subunit alcohol dehydrogenase family)|nr:SDR family oxidoreductase [Rhizomicrobium sp.]